MIQSYVVGFLFSEDDKKVVLIRKDKPKWQAGLLNGVGGKIEAGESPHRAMIREFKEEAGLDIQLWKPIVKIYSDSYEVHFFMAKGDVTKVTSVTSEKVKVVDVLKLPKNVLWDVRWLVPLALAKNVRFPLEINDPSLPGQG